MSDLPKGFYAGELYCYPYGHEDDSTFGYIPGQPRIESTEGCALAASFIRSPLAAVLSVQAVWSAMPDAIAAAQKEIQERYPNAKTPSLRIADLADTRASLTITGEDGSSFTFEPRVTSGSDFYHVVFSETLKSTEKPAALNALRGQTGILKLSYTGKLVLPETISARIAGDLAQELKALAPKKVEKKSGGFFSLKKKEPEPEPVLPNLADCVTSVDRALSTGTLEIIRDETPNVSAELRTKVETALRTNTAKLLCDKILQMGEDAIYLSSFLVNQTLSDSESIQYQITRVADLGNCFAANKDAGLVTDTDAEISEPKR